MDAQDHPIIDVKTGQVVGNVEGSVVYGVSTRTHTAFVNQVNTGQSLLVDITTGNTVFASKDQWSPVFTQASLDGSSFLVMDRDGSASIVNAATGHVTHPGWRTPSGMFSTAAITADGTHVAFATVGGVTLYSVTNPEEVRTIGDPEFLDHFVRQHRYDSPARAWRRKTIGATSRPRESGMSKSTSRLTSLASSKWTLHMVIASQRPRQ
jgi:hypothetical protein